VSTDNPSIALSSQRRSKPVQADGRLRLLLAVLIAVGALLVTVPPLFGLPGAIGGPDTTDADRRLLAEVSADRSAAYLGRTVVLTYGWGLLAVAAAGLLALAGGRGRRLARIGGSLAVLGCLGGAALFAAYGMVLRVLSDPAVDPGAALTVLRAEKDTSDLGGGAFGLPYAVLVPLGFLLLAIGLGRGRILPWWAAALLAAGAIVQGSGTDGIAGALLALPFCLGLLAVAVLLVRRDRAAGVDDQHLSVG
jgi:hypothetical protein